MDEKINDHPLTLTKRYRGCRGPDKTPRKININSIYNLKPFQQISDSITLDQIIKNPSQKQASSWKFWVVLLIILGIIVGYFIYKYYKEKTEQSYNQVSFSDIINAASNG